MTSAVLRPVYVLSGGAHPSLAGQLAQELALTLTPTEVGAFADGETRVWIGGDVRDAIVVLVQPTGPPVNDHLMALALLADAARAAGAARVVAVVPYFGYARQDRRDRPGDPRAAQVAGRLLSVVGVDHLITLDLHSPALESALAMPATLLGAENVFQPRLAAQRLADLVVVSPDAGGLKRAQRYASALGGDLAVVAKERPRADTAVAVRVLGDVRGRACLVVDDLASTGRTLAGAAGALRRAGAREVHAAVTHPVLAPGARERLLGANFGFLFTTDSVAVQPGPGLEVVPVAPLLVRAVRDVCGLEPGTRPAPPAVHTPHLSGLEFRALEESHESDRTDPLPGPRGRRPAPGDSSEGA
jgi:ribose-phosphate pyrophosphokinase